jgi:D-alanine-D-alanine ligase
MSKRILLLLGGESAEREVSLVSGKACADALRSLGHKVEVFDCGRDVSALMDALDPRPEIVFNALHGRWGEDGCIQGILDLLGLPYTHSGLLASALAMDKPMAKKVFADAGLRCPAGEVVSRDVFHDGDPLPRPYVIKPLHEGSSKGVIIVHAGGNEPPLDSREWAFGPDVLVEPFVPGRELTVGVMGDRPLGVTEIRPLDEFYDYTAKYTEGKAEHLIPAPVPDGVLRQAMDDAVTAHKALGCRGVSRADFRYDDGPETDSSTGLYLLEVNTQPGMTPLSLVPEQADHIGISFPELVQWMVEHAACD